MGASVFARRVCAAVLFGMAVGLVGGCPAPTDMNGDPNAGQVTPGPGGPRGLAGERGLTGEQGPIGPEGPQGPAGADGANGMDGADGADGQLRIYGDSTAGDVEVTANAALGELNADLNFQFHDLTIAAGVTLDVPSGTVIRCTGKLVNEGVIRVGRGGSGGVGSGNTGTGPEASADPGVSRRAATSGTLGDNAFIRSGGSGGLGLSLGEARVLFDPLPGGGGGGPAQLDFGGDGGGGLLVLALEGVENSGMILADGQTPPFSGGGGGGGGAIVLASPTSVTHTGTISAMGGAGVGPGFNRGAGGGGGGGIVHLISPEIAATGVVAVQGGLGGAAGVITVTPRTGGGGGGACGGDGGNGGEITNAPSNTASAGSPGGPGYFIQSKTNPTALF